MSTTDQFGIAVSILQEALAEFRTEIDGFKASNRALTEAIRALVTTLRTPTTRTATLELPSGPATMTVKEQH